MSKDIYKLYKITNTINSKVYIGYTTQSIQKRFNNHRSHGFLLHNSIKKHGIDLFQIEHIASAYTKEDMSETERQLIEQYNSMAPNGYNLTTGGEKAWSHTEETRQILSNKLKGRTLSKETRQRISDAKKDTVPWNKGKTPPEETKRKLSIRLKQYWKDKKVAE